MNNVKQIIKTNNKKGNLVSSSDLITGKVATVKSLKTDVSSVSPSSERMEKLTTI